MSLNPRPLVVYFVYSTPNPSLKGDVFLDLHCTATIGNKSGGPKTSEAFVESRDGCRGVCSWPLKLLCTEELVHNAIDHTDPAAPRSSGRYIVPVTQSGPHVCLHERDCEMLALLQPFSLTYSGTRSSFSNMRHVFRVQATAIGFAAKSPQASAFRLDRRDVAPIVHGPPIEDLNICPSVRDGSLIVLGS